MYLEIDECEVDGACDDGYSRVNHYCGFYYDEGLIRRFVFWLIILHNLPVCVSVQTLMNVEGACSVFNLAFFVHFTPLVFVFTVWLFESTPVY